MQQRFRALIPVAPPPEDLGALSYWPIYSDASNALYHDFADEAFTHLNARKADVGRLQDRSDWERYRTKTRQKIFELVGPLPDKTPLNPRVVGVVDKGSYRIEKVVYESQPGFHVPAALFVPQPLKGPAPAILYCSGHTDLAFRSLNYSSVCVNLVRKGFVVLAFDPIGQGERIQYLDPATGKSEFDPGFSTREHSRAGTQCFLTGDSLARHMVWDGIRGLDYLLTRHEVDPARLGVTGRSGGGTQTAYIAAVDDRVRAAAPEIYITDLTHLLRQSGPQDAEQNLYRGIARRFDLADLLIARAPKPNLVLSTTRDIFSLTGARLVQAEVQRAYAALGNAADAGHSIADGVHESPVENREAMYAFFQKHLGIPGDSRHEDIAPLPPEDLRITPTGQVGNSLRGETVFSLNRRRAESLVQQLDLRRRDPAAHLAAAKAAAAQLSGHAVPPISTAEPLFSGSHERDGYTIEKYVLPVDDRYGIPLLVMVPDSAPKSVVLYLHAGGKAAAAAPGGEMETLVRQGCAVVAPDMFGAGELGTATMPSRGEKAERTWFAYLTLGKATLGRQAADVIRAARFTEDRFGVAPRDQLAVARGNLGPLLLHTAVLEDMFARIALVGAPLSYRSIALTEYYDLDLTPALVPAALTAYDLPDLAAALAPRPVLLAAPSGGDSQPAAEADIALDTAFPARVHGGRGANPGFTVVRGDEAAVASALSAWLR